MQMQGEDAMDATLLRRRALRRAHRALWAAAFGFAVALTALSAALVKRASSVPALAVVVRDDVRVAVPTPPRGAERVLEQVWASPEPVVPPTSSAATTPAPIPSDASSEPPVLEDASIRYFGGRRVRPARQLWMTVTAYSPDHRSCGRWADGITASNKSVWTNGMRLVAADTRILPFGTLLSIPGYADDEVVPVLDRGGAIKGMRLDVLYSTHAEARQWGVRKIPVTVWEYVDETE